MPKRRLRAKLLLAALTLVVADLGLAQVAKVFLFGWAPADVEHAFRIHSEIYHHDLGKMVDAVALWGRDSYRLKTNSLGFKDAKCRTVELQSSARRVVLIGDSFTEGIGLEFEKTYAGIIARSAAKRGVEVLNAGVVSYSPAIYFRKAKFLLEDAGLRFTDLVVFLDVSDIADEALGYDIDDAGRVTHRLEETGWTGRRRPIAVPVVSRVKQFLRQNSVMIRLGDAIKDAAAGGQPPPMTGKREARWTVDDELFEQFGRLGLEKARMNLERLLEVLGRNGVRMTLVVYPWPDQIVAGDRTSRHVAYWQAWSKTVGIDFVDLFPLFFRQEQGEVLAQYFIPGDLHFNEAGHRLVAEAFLAQFDLPPLTGR